MAWQETRPGHWERPLGDNESMIKIIAEGDGQTGKDIWCISVTAHFDAHLRNNESTNFLSATLLSGWKLLRFRHPSIATTIYEDSVCYDVPGSVTLENWARETFTIVDDADIHPDDLIARLPPSQWATLHYLKSNSSVILRFSHWMTDGIGAFHLLNAFFQAVVDGIEEQLIWGTEVVRLVLSVEEALELSPTPTTEEQSAAQQYLDTLAHHRGALGTPYHSQKESHLLPGATRNSHSSFSVEETTKLLDECCERGIRLEAAVHAAITTTAYVIGGPASNLQHHSTTIRHSLRPCLPSPYDGPAGAAGLYTAGYVIKVPPSQPWLEYAQQYEAEYQKGVTKTLLCSRRHYARVMKDLLLKMRSKPLDPSPSGLDISYIPDADALVESVHASGAGNMVIGSIGIQVEVVSRYLYVFSWVFSGKLELHLVYNEGFYDSGFTTKVVNHVQKVLVSNLLAES